MLDPFQGRARVRFDDSGCTVVLPSQRRWAGAAFLLLWLGGWLFGLLTALGMLASGVGRFMIVWLAAWIAGGAYALATFLWMVAGSETLRIQAGQLEVSRSIPVWTRRTRCDFSMVRNLRTIERTPAGLFGQRSHMAGLFLGKGEGTLRFDYGVHTLGFGLDLDRAEADHIAKQLILRYPGLGPDAK